jgi:hypothetical protein
LVKSSLAIAFVAIATLLGLRAAEAQACSCEIPTLSFRPSSGAVDVPRNSIVVVVTPLANPTGQVRVLDDLGEAVAGTVSSFSVRDPFHGWLVFTPSAPLSADTSHSIEIDGTISSTFTTGSTESSEAPAFGGVVSVEAELIAAGEDVNTCWRHADSLDQLTLELSPLDPAVSHVIVDVRPANEAEYSFRVLVPVEDFASPYTVVMSTDQCSIAGPELVSGEEYCVSVTAYDRYGNASESHEACSGATECVGDSPTGRCASSKGCSTQNDMPGYLVFLLGVPLLRRRWRRA